MEVAPPPIGTIGTERAHNLGHLLRLLGQILKRRWLREEINNVHHFDSNNISENIDELKNLPFVLGCPFLFLRLTETVIVLLGSIYETKIKHIGRLTSRDLEQAWFQTRWRRIRADFFRRLFRKKKA